MLFNSIEFMLFLPLVFVLYWYAFRPLKIQNALIVAASYVFYGWWNTTFLWLILFTSVCSYVCGLLIARFEGHRRRQQWVSAFNIVVNLLVLGYYKYYNFFVDSLSAALQGLGLQLDLVTRDILLPVGISFYTFQALSYTIDVYQRKLPATRDLLAFLAYISFFPQLVAGPIERATHLLPQFLAPRRFDYARAVGGLRLMLWGMFKKVVIADQCAQAVNAIWGYYTQCSGYELLLGALFFTIQIYGDFSGYSDMAIGAARLFGFDLMQNFRLPYFSRHIGEFWQRWHISLTSWFRDYIYIPLGGSRAGRAATVRNTLVVFLLSGLWHGANWTFVLWGLYHGLLFVPLILWTRQRRFAHAVAEGRRLPSLREALQMLLTFVLAMVGWILFRAPSVADAARYLSHLLRPSLFAVAPAWLTPPGVHAGAAPRRVAQPCRRPRGNPAHPSPPRGACVELCPLHRDPPPHSPEPPFRANLYLFPVLR